jgi:hypothetical protein
MNSNISTNKNIYVILLVGVSLSVVVGLLITRKLILGKGSAKNLDTGNDSRSTKDYSSYFNDKYRWHKDTNTKNIVNKLHPSYRGRVAEFFSKIEDELGLTAYATSGYRTFEKQAELHKQNSQNAKAGFSSHNFGYAIDINVKNKDGNIFLKKADTSKKWRDSGVVPLSEKLGLSWGGDGNFGTYHDPVHFYIKPNNKGTDDLRALVNQGKVDKDGYVLA